jgi:hypothetical protein
MSIVLQGSTSGSITLQEPAVAGTTTLNLPAVSGTIVTTGSPQSGGVIQVIQGTYGTEVSNNTDTPADTGLSASITPKFSTSKILVLVTQNGCTKVTGTTSSGVTLNLVRNSTTILDKAAYAVGYNAASTFFIGTISFQYLDSPATTSATTYKTQFLNNTNSTGVRVQQDGNTPSTITLIEVAA